MVTLMWAVVGGGLDGVNVEHTLLLTDSSHNLATHTTSATNWTTSLQFGGTYLVTTCGHTLSSDNYSTNITIDECEHARLNPALH
jgi:hypothetical protein